MKVVRHNGHGQTLCIGCLLQGKQPFTWDSMIFEIQYNSGTKIGCFCPMCYVGAMHLLKNYIE